MTNRKITFILERSDHIELHDLLKVTGACPTGGSAKSVIAEGKVLVDGRIEKRKRCKIRKGQEVTYNSSVIRVERGE